MPQQYKVPENIHMEDKVIGPLTLKQFMYFFGAFGITALLFTILNPSDYFFFGLIIMPIWLIAAIMGFYRPNDRPMDVFVLAMISFYLKPRQRVWKRETTNVTDIVTRKIEKKEVKHEKKAPDKSQLEILTRIVDSGGQLEQNPNDTDRFASLDTKEPTENKNLIDPLEDTGKHENLLSKYLGKVVGKKDEPTISELSSVSPDKTFDYSYQNVGQTSNEVLEIANIPKTDLK